MFETRGSEVEAYDASVPPLGADLVDGPHAVTAAGLGYRLARRLAGLTSPGIAAFMDVRREARAARDHRLELALAARGWTMLVKPTWDKEFMPTTIAMRGGSVVGVLAREGYSWVGVEQRSYCNRFRDESLDGLLFAGASIQDGNPDTDLISMQQAPLAGERLLSRSLDASDAAGGPLGDVRSAPIAVSFREAMAVRDALQDDESEDYFARPRLRA